MIVVDSLIGTGNHDVVFQLLRYIPESYELKETFFVLCFDKGVSIGEGCLLKRKDFSCFNTIGDQRVFSVTDPLVFFCQDIVDVLVFVCQI